MYTTVPVRPTLSEGSHLVASTKRLDGPHMENGDRTPLLILRSPCSKYTSLFRIRGVDDTVCERRYTSQRTDSKHMEMVFLSRVDETKKGRGFDATKGQRQDKQ